MNKRLIAKCDILISQAKSNTLRYEDLLAKINENSDLKKANCSIPNALEYLKLKGYDVVRSDSIQSELKEIDTVITEKPEYVVDNDDTHEYEFDDSDNKQSDDVSNTLARNNEIVRETENDYDTLYADSEDKFESVLSSISDETDIAPTAEELEDIEVEEELLQGDDSFIESTMTWYIKSIGYIPNNKLLSADEEKDLARKAQNGDIEAKQRLVTCNLKLVISIAKRYIGVASGIEQMDLIQHGNIGLMKAVDKFDPDLGFRFSTYSTWWIKQTITRALADEGRTVRLPVHSVEQLRYIKRAITELQDANGYAKPTFEQIAKYMMDKGMIVSPRTRISSEDVKNYLQLFDNSNVVSTDTPVGADSDDADSLLGDFIPDDAPSADIVFEQKDLHDKIQYIFSTFLTAKEADIMSKRFGIDSNYGRPMTLEQIAIEYNVSRERIRQIESKVMRKIRHNMKIRNILKDYY